MLLIILRSFIKRETLVSAWKLIRSIKSYFQMDRQEEADQLFVSVDPPPPFDPLKPSLPVSFPIKKLEDLESRSYFKSFHFSFNKASVPLQSSSSTLSLPARPRVLVCHDMAGGYADDKWIQGGTNAEAYAIWHWYLIDVFVYFSHSLVTIPPPCWTNAAHTHGVKVLGTFITEWDEGRVISATLLSTKESAQMYAERLTELAVTLGFDGWLINMEVRLDLGQIPNLKEFVSHLTKTMHSALPGSLVIWYDSVTTDGNLRWQNQLNGNNKPFFDLCDGIFVNYSWTVDYPKLSAAVAGERKFDVYMGIDVFGRGTYGGGQWNTNVALDVLKKDGVSAAIFAPGWVYETKQPPDFQTAQNRWWGLVEKSWGLVQSYPKVLPFYSNFDQGHGYHFSVDGEQVSSDPWCNISCQSFQPALEISGDPDPNAIQVLVDFKDGSYSGGGNITFKGTLEDNTYVTTRLFQGEVKSDGSSLVGLALQFSSNTNEETLVLITSWGRTLLTMNQFSSKFSRVIKPHQVRKLERDGPTAPTWTILDSSIKMSGYTLTEIQVVCYKSRSELITKLSLEQDLSSGKQVATSDYFAALGHITVKNSEQNTDFPPSTSWVVDGQFIAWTSGSQGAKTLNVKIVWKLKDGDNSLFSKYIIYVKKLPKQAVGGEEYLGVARVGAFYVSDLVVPSGTSSLNFIIQVCGVDGACQKLADSPMLQLVVEGS